MMIYTIVAIYKDNAQSYVCHAEGKDLEEALIVAQRECFELNGYDQDDPECEDVFTPVDDDPSRGLLRIIAAFEGAHLDRAGLAVDTEQGASY